MRRSKPLCTLLLALLLLTCAACGQTQTEQSEDTGDKGQYMTDPIPEGKPAPVEPQDTAVDTTVTHTCIFSISCDTILDNMDKCVENKKFLVPADGVMKKHGHYCKVCGEYKANEKFSGKGHASHICKSCASLPAETQAELMTLNRLLNLPWRLSKEQLSWLKNRLKDRRPDVRALAQEQYEMRFPPRHLEDDEFNFFDEESFIE